MEVTKTEGAMLDLLVEHRRWLAVALMGAGIVSLFIAQEVARQRHLSRMSRECSEAKRRKG